MKKKLGVHKNLVDCSITEMIDTETDKHYFSAVICGWKNFKFYPKKNDGNEFFEKVIEKIKDIRKNIENDTDYINKIESIFYI